MSTPPQPPGANTTKQPTSKPTYISSSGHTLDSLPLTARLNRAADSLYNFVGLYLVSLLSLDPHSAAQNSRFNTRGPGRRPVASRGPTATASARVGGAAGGGVGSAGPRGGGGGGGGGDTGGRRMGTVDDVRGPDCGSCG